MRFRLAVLPGLVASLWLTLGAGTAGAQQRQAVPDGCRLSVDPEGNTEGYVDPSCVPNDPNARFRLRALGDFAGTGMRISNPNVAVYITNAGPMDTGLELAPLNPTNTGPMSVRGTRAAPTGWRLNFQSIQFLAAASRTDWLRNREIVPELRNAVGGGWTAPMNFDRAGGAHQWQGADASVGRLHSGAQAGPDGCLNHGLTVQDSRRDFPQGFPLLAGSDCPETWGSVGWLGRRWIGPIDNWLRYFRDVDPMEFTFDFRHVPQTYWQTTQRPMTVSDNFQTYGAASDWGADALRNYGSVIPGQTGDPDWDGYPIGLTIEFQAYSFNVPAVSGGFIHEAHIINDSEKVYGVPLDYDSLWFGYYTQPGGTAYTAAFYIPEMGTLLHTSNDFRNYNAPGTCTAFIRAIGNIPGCTRALEIQRAFQYGATGHMVLRSPLGDLRNKHFSNPNSPFYAPGHPLAGDTITYNRAQQCSDTCTRTLIVAFGVRARYGMITANVPVLLAGNDPRNLTDAERYHFFMGNNYDESGNFIYCDPAAWRGEGCMGYVVPGEENYVDVLNRAPTPTWTYSNRPPGAPIGPDTLFLGGCRPPVYESHPGRNQCFEIFQDSLADRTRNYQSYGFFGPIAGPFPLKAGDTVPWVVATFALPLEEEVVMQNSEGRYVPGPGVQAWYNFYVNDFYLGPSQPPPPSIVSVATEGGASQYGDPSVTLFLDASAEDWRDPFTLKFIEDLRNPTPGTFPAQIAAANPNAADELEALISRNLVDTVYIFKSCDLGATVTATGALRCDPAPARDRTRATIAPGWQAYAWLTPSNGRFPKQWTDTNVGGGRRYLYTLVATTKGLEFTTPYQTIDGETRDTTLVIVRPGETPFAFQTTNPWSVEVYVPLVQQAGFEPARIEVTRELGPLRWYRQISSSFFPDASKAGNYRLMFGRDLEVREYRTTGGEGLDSTVVVLDREALALLPDGTVQRLNTPSLTFVNRNSQPIAIGGDVDLMTVTREPTANGTVEITRMNRKSGVLFNADTNEILFASGAFGSAFTPPEFVAHPQFGRFTLSVTDATPATAPGTYTLAAAGSSIGQTWRYRGATLENANPSVVQLTGTANFEHTGLRFGLWAFTFKAPFFARYDQLPAYNVNDPQQTAAAFRALLEQRGVASRTEVNQEVLDILRGAAPEWADLTMDDLIEVKLPFLVRNLEFGTPCPTEAFAETCGAPVRVAMLRENKRSTILLGSGVDTVTATVPEDVWIPGEPIILIEEVDLATADPGPDPDTYVVRLDGQGQPIVSPHWRVTVKRFTLGCSSPRATCNPIRGPGAAGAPGYVEVRPVGDPDFPEGWLLRVAYRDLVTSQSVFEFQVVPEKLGRAVTRVTQSMLDNVRVVPNPYLGLSAFDYLPQENVRRLIFTGLPPSGSIHIFTASGQYVQRLDFEPETLQGTGDLAWNMNTKEGTQIAAGVYMFVLETTDPESGARLTKNGKFIVIK